MRAGAYNVQITVERKSVTKGAVYNEDVVTWVPLVEQPGAPGVAQRWWAEAQDVPPSRSESVAQGLQLARNQIRLRMRWRNDIDSSMRVTLHRETDVVCQIIGGPAERGGRKRELELMLERYSS